MPQITLPDGSTRDFDHPVSIADVAQSIGPGLAKATVAGKINNELADASDLISEAALAVEMDAFVEDMGLTIHPHPTLGEAVMEAANKTLGHAIHVMN